MPVDITEDVLEENICKALSLTGVNVVPNDLHPCDQMKKTDRVILKLNCSKQKNSLMYKHKNCLYNNYNIFQTTRFNHTMIFFKLTD